MKLVKAIERVDTQSRWNKSASQDVETDHAWLELMLTCILIEERQEKSQSCRSRQDSQSAGKTGQPPVSTAHSVEAEYGEKKKERLIIGGSKEKGAGEHGKVDCRAIGAFSIKVFLHQPVQYQEHTQTSQI